MALPGSDRLSRGERVGLILLGLFLLAFAGLVELRSCYQSTRKTDFEVYLRAAWAVRNNLDVYSVTCSNFYHYTYPPAFAIVMVPFADAPKGLPRDGLLPFAVSVSLWTALNYLLVARMAHVLAGLVLPNETRGSRRWWYARTVPVYVAIGGIGYSIGFGQVNVVLTAMLVEMLRCSLTGKGLHSGLWLAAAMVIKVFPAYLILYPLVRRDGKALLGTALGLTIGLGVIPVAALGLQETQVAYQSYAANVLLPGALGRPSSGSVRELIDLPSNDSQSILAAIHSNLHPVRAMQPGSASKETRLAHNAISLIFTLCTVFIILRRGKLTHHESVIACGLFMVLMLHITPMSHMHYYAFGYVLAAGLWLRGLKMHPERVFPSYKVSLPLTLWCVGTALPLFPGAIFEVMRYRGLGLAASLVLWSVGIMAMAKRPLHAAAESPVSIPAAPEAARAAA